MDTRLTTVLRKLKSKAPFTYVAFGDSHTYGARCDGWITQFGLNGASGGPPDSSWNSFANLFGSFLTKINPNVNYINSGNPGYTTIGGLTVVASQVVDHDPDLVTIEFALNDWTYNMAIATFQANYQSLITQILATGATLILITPAPAAETSFTWGWIGTPLPDLSLTLESYITAILGLAASNNLVCVDVYHMFVEQFQRGFTGQFWLLDYSGANDIGGEHPSELGHTMYFNAMVQKCFGQKQI